MNYNDYLKQQIQAKYGYATPNDFLQSYKKRDKTASICWGLVLLSIILVRMGLDFAMILLMSPLWIMISNDGRRMKHALVRHPRQNSDPVDEVQLLNFLSENLSQFGLGGFQNVERKMFGVKVQGSTFVKMESGKFPYLLNVPYTHEVHKKPVNWFKIEYFDQTNRRLPDVKGLRGKKAKENINRMVPIIVETMNYYFEHVCTVK